MRLSPGSCGPRHWGPPDLWDFPEDTILDRRPLKDRKRRSELTQVDERAAVKPLIREPCPKCGQWCVVERKTQERREANRALEAYRDDPAYWMDQAAHLSRLPERRADFREAIKNLERLGVKIGFRLTWRARS